MAPILVIQDRINTLLETLHTNYHSYPESRDRVAKMLKDYTSIYGKYKLYPDEIDALFKLDKLPAKNIERTKEVLELLLLRMEREMEDLE